MLNICTKSDLRTFLHFIMSGPQDNAWPNGRITLPPIRQVFKDEFMGVPPVQRPASMSDVGLDFHDSMVTETAGELQQSSSRRQSPSHLPTSRYTSQPSSYGERQSTIYPESEQNAGQSRIYTTQSSDGTNFNIEREGVLFRRNQTYSSTSTIAGQSSLSRPVNLPINSQLNRTIPEESAHHTSRWRNPLLYMSANHPGSGQVNYPPRTVVAPYGASTGLERQQTQGNEYATSTRPTEGSQTLYSNPPSHLLEEGSVHFGKYSCKYCGKLFTRPSSLRTHLNTHTGEKPFICPFEGCARGFSVYSNMKRHMRVHNSSSNEETNRGSSPSDRTDSPGSYEKPLMKSFSPSALHHRRQESSASTSSNNSR